MPIDTAVRRLKRRRTKIVATLGPASNTAETITRLVDAGVNVFRMNMSHGEHDGHRDNFQMVRDVGARAGEAIAVLADLCGPKIRLGRFEGGEAFLDAAARVTVTTRDVVGSATLIPSQYAALADDVSPGDRILIDDGKIELRVESVSGSEIACEVIQGGVVKDRKGLNLPGVNVSAPSVTPKDKADARFALDLGVDYLALSFVRSAADVRLLRNLMTEVGRTIRIIAKIEKPEALADIDAILDAADGIMVARGDLGVELPPESVPIAQNQLVDLALQKAKPVIVATQMLESMIENARPTRAEVSDVSNAVQSGADAVMLSAETAAGQHPVGAVQMMDRVARDREAYMWQTGAFGSLGARPSGAPPLRLEDGIARATAQLSRDLMVRAIVVWTVSGRTVGIMARARPQAPVLALTPNPATYRSCSLLWGVIPRLVEQDAMKRPHEVARDMARIVGLAEPGDHILEIRGFDADPQRNTPTITTLAV